LGVDFLGAFLFLRAYFGKEEMPSQCGCVWADFWACVSLKNAKVENFLFIFKGFSLDI
jgi:hypothetical protein